MKSKTHRNNAKQSTTRKIGGSVLATGGFGCVFRPALVCKGKKMRKSKFVSKLMTTRHAEQEYQFINSIRAKLKSIPDFSDHFLLNDIDMCEPKPLTPGDLSNFDKKCRALTKDGIESKNINDSLHSLKLLNIPDGGIAIDDYIFTGGSFDKLLTLNKKMVELFTAGIVPMNKNHIYHSDIKDSNILIDTSLKTRLIDWGLCTEYNPKSAMFPDAWVNRPLQFNVPFSVILFTKLFKERYTEYLKRGGTTDKKKLREFVFRYLKEWIKIRPGHYRVINDIMFMIFSRELKMNQRLKWKVVEQRYTIPYIVNYLVEVLTHYTKTKSDGTFDPKPYLDNVYIHIVDIWGFLSTYMTMIELFHNNYDILTSSEHVLFKNLKLLILKYLYNSRIKPIEHDDLKNDLNEITKLLEHQTNLVNKPNTVIQMSSNISFKRESKKSRRNQPLGLVSSRKTHAHRKSYSRKR
jgi:serine/threonine protein kinase